MVYSVAHADVQSLHPLVVNPDLGETKQPWPGLEWSLWECEGRSQSACGAESSHSGSVCTCAASLCLQKQLSSVSLLPWTGFLKLAELLPPVVTPSLQFTDTTMQEVGLLWALQMVLDPCTPPG